MKAVILAGGEGTRLQPVSIGRPKAMTPILGRPVIEHIIRLLRRHGITRICIALGHADRAVKEYLEDGTQLGVQLTYRVEDLPLGTAGGVRRCLDFWGGEDVLVIGGDCVCDLDLTAAIRAHREKDALATLIVCRHPRPLEYGMVLADAEGKVERFLEKPAWSQVVTNTVNTGVYILSPGMADRIRVGEACDFAGDIFPALLERGEALYAWTADGYWRDIGDCENYLDCICDVLSGKVQLDMGAEQRQPGVWSAEPIPEGVTVVPPCWLGPEVCVGSGSLIGPHAVLERGSRVGTRSLVQRSVLMGAQVGDRVTLYGTILCRDSRVEEEAVLNEGVVLGERTRVGERAVLMERVRLWPGRTVQAGGRLTYSITAGEQAAPLRFGDGGVIRGKLGEELNPEMLLALGRALGAEGQVALGGFGGAGARMLVRAAASGITAVGGTALYHDMECAAQAAWLAESHQFPVSLFVEQDGEKVYLHLFDRSGLPLGRGRERKLEHLLLRGEPLLGESGRVGSCEHLTAGVGDYAADAARRAGLRRLSPRTVQVAVTGHTPADRAIRLTLEKLGCRVVPQWKRGIPAFSGSHGGMRLSARDESGALLSPQQVLAMVALVELENGGGRLAVPDDASAALELIAAGFDKRVLRLGRDGEPARQIYQSLPWLRDAAFAAARLCSRMALTGEPLERLYAKTPRLSDWKREVPLVRDRGEVMRELIVQTGRDAVLGEGVRLRSRGGWVYLVPLTRRSAMKVVAEGADLETAAELCDFYAAQVSRVDGKMPGRKTK